MEYKFNDRQSPFNPEEQEDQEYLEFMQEVLTGIQFVKNLVSPDRKRARELPRYDFEYAIVDDKGNPTGETRIENKIDPDLTNPHILEDMDYFRQAALHFEKHGKYTLLTPNRHPKSEYTKFWREEKRRCLEGLVRPSDGEWIPGYYYWYLNYSRIHKVVETQKLSKNKNARGNRVESFPTPWDGDYLYFHYIEKGEANGKFGTVLKTRGRGYSYKGGANPARNFVLVKESSNFLMAFDDAYLGGDGIWSKAMDNLDWVAKHTPWPRLRYVNKQADYTIKGGYKRKGEDAIYGNKTLMDGIVTRNNEDKARGIRGKYAAFEEAGKYPKLLDVWGIAESSFKQGNVVYGYMVAFGTGGSEEANFQALENLFRHPDTYNIYGLPNVFDFNVDQEEEVSFFMPEYVNREGCMDKDGNSDVTAALELIYKDRKNKKYNSSDPFAIVREKAERPITPTEAMMRKTGTVFPVYALTEELADIRSRESKFVAPHYVVTLHEDSKGNVKWEYNTDNYPIRKYPHSPDQKHGAVELFALPDAKASGAIQSNRYIICVDPYVIDGDTTSKSLGAAFVFDLFTDTIVAEYTGRPTFAKDFFEIVRKLAIMYNAQVYYENNKMDLFDYFRVKNALPYLAKTPDYLFQKDYLSKRGYGNSSYGIPATQKINQLALSLQAEWLMEDNPNPFVEEVDGVMTPVTVPNYKKIKSIGYLEELVRWNPDNNFDRVSAMGIGMIARRDKIHQIEAAKDNRIKRRHEDPFFKKIFRKAGNYSYNAITK